MIATLSIIYSYLSIFVLLIFLFYSGLSFLIRATSIKQSQLLLAAGSIFGICLHIFLLNLTAHFIKGVPGIIIALLIQVIATFFIVKLIPQPSIVFPKGKEMIISILLILLWGVFLYQITAHAITDGADSILHQSFAARFIRGDYPMHQPWQPDYVAYYHFGSAELLGSFHALTNTPYYFLHPFIAFFMLLFISQILTWIIPQASKFSLKSIIFYSFPALVALISLGGFFIVFPIKLEFSILNITTPTLSNSFENYGSPTNLDALIFFIHRLLAISFFISLLVLILYSKRGLLGFFAFIIYLSSIALTDESILVVTIIPILIVSFFTIFKKSIKIFLLTVSISCLIILFQGGIITETVLNNEDSHSNILLYPSDHNLPHEKYRSYRESQQKSKFFYDTQNFNWFHPGIIWQLLFYLVVILFLNKKRGNIKTLHWIFYLSAFSSFIAFHILVPKGYTHPNGNRFLALAYYLSGIGIAFFCSYWIQQKSKLPTIVRIFIYGVIVWITLFSLIPPFLNLFPRKSDNWFIIKNENIPIEINWVRYNIPHNKRIVSLTDSVFSNSGNINLVTKAGALTPMWPNQPRVHDSFDIGPTYSDLYFTLNPEIINQLKIDYLLINNSFILQLPKKRQHDLRNKEFFTQTFISADNNTSILKVNQKFLQEGENYEGTFQQLDKIAPSMGTFCIDYPPHISANTYRILRLLFHNRNMYCDQGGAFYNARIDVEIHTFGERLDKYDYLVLGSEVDPKDICQCQATLLWTGLGNGVKFWKVQ